MYVCVLKNFLDLDSTYLDKRILDLKISKVTEPIIFLETFKKHFHCLNSFSLSS